ncbi:MAG TPA: heat-inducible transcription repressor HrcA [Clostridiales bacterium]|nr:heat-inducible transcription repressor HrcA [Clostridiales bacterium]
MKKNLSDRKIKAIKVIVEEYLKNPTPVSSGEIQRKYFKDLCSATIRSEMSSLEDLGYLVQPHASSGRIPTVLAYKFYVENFVDKKTLHYKDKQLIENAFKSGFNKIEDIVRTTAKIISDVTNYTSVIVINNYNEILIREIKLVPIEDAVLVIIITDNGVLKDNIIKLNHPIEEGYIKDATLILNRIFQNLKLKDLEKTPVLIDKELERFSELIQTVMDMLENYTAKEDAIYVEGVSKILDYPDASLETARHLINVINKKSDLIDILSVNDVNDIEFSVKIGKDETGLVDNCAVIVAKILVDGEEVGKAGVIGPKRMDYAKVISVLSYIGDTFDEIE